MRAVVILVAVLTVANIGCQKEPSPIPLTGKADQSQPQDNAPQDAGERTRLENERLQLAKDQKQLAEEQLKLSKRMADEQYVQGEVENKRQQLRSINEKARQDALRAGIDPSTVYMLDENKVLGPYEEKLRKSRGLD